MKFIGVSFNIIIFNNNYESKYNVNFNWSHGEKLTKTKTKKMFRFLRNLLIFIFIREFYATKFVYTILPGNQNAENIFTKKTLHNSHHLALKFTLTALKVLRSLKHSILNSFNFTFCRFIV